ncbi:M15 family metallopeptidase [Jeongeupia wiesaeckerbachi]|uniref:M15 family metallopeptidase n=1 Tax=Jeongeupia wiesaeckerbachi TaxID=3051218 RepID=UPI003D809DC3
MNNVVLLLSGLSLLLLALAWLGWRFFYWDRSVVVAQAPAAPQPDVVVASRPVLTDSQPVLIREQRPSRWRGGRLLLVSVLLISMVVLLTLRLAGYHVLGELGPQEYASLRNIQLALTEEKLVPPPPLPPSMFVTSERPSLAGADRDWSRLDPDFVQRVLALMARMEARGYPLALLEGYRSPERQDSLASQENLVTKAKGGQSKHQYGMAVDLAPIRSGKIVISERDPWAMQAYTALGEEAEAAKLTWGGRWSFKDYGHIEVPGSIASLTRAKR